MSTALLTPNSISPLLRRGRNVLEPAWGWMVTRSAPASVTTLASPEATALNTEPGGFVPRITDFCAAAGGGPSRIQASSAAAGAIQGARTSMVCPPLLELEDPPRVALPDQLPVALG